MLPVAFAAAVSAFDPRFGWLWLYELLGLVPLFPLFARRLGRALQPLRHRPPALRAASYNILAVLLGAGALILVPRIAEAASGVVGIDPATGQVVLSLALAAS